MADGRDVAGRRNLKFDEDGEPELSYGVISGEPMKWGLWVQDFRALMKFKPDGIYKGECDYLLETPEVYDATHEALAAQTGPHRRAAISEAKFNKDQAAMYRVLMGLISQCSTAIEEKPSRHLIG